MCRPPPPPKGIQHPHRIAHELLFLVTLHTSSLDTKVHKGCAIGFALIVTPQSKRLVLAIAADRIHYPLAAY
eukprot:scaffold96072_cov30-Tisochrysis_lutea.AAC.2